MIGATNVGEDKYDPGPVIRHPFKLIQDYSPEAIILDLYSGCPGFNLGVELVFMLSLSGVLSKGDLSVIVGAESLHRSKAFRPLDTAGIIFGDDALAAALETEAELKPVGHYSKKQVQFTVKDDMVADIAEKLLALNGHSSTT